MHRYRRLLIPLLPITLVGGGALFLFGTTDFSTDVFSNDQTRYAEMAAIAEQIPAATASSTAKLKLPILVYHIIRPSDPSDSQAVKDLAHSPDVFDAEMKHLGDAGYTIVSFVDLEKYYQDGTPLPQKPIIISFDDGWSDQFQYAFPVLKKYHYSATFFVFTNPIGTRGFITWDQLREMQKAGMHIESHSRSHPYLTRIHDPAKLWNEINGSKERLEKELGVPVTEFAYPFGQYTPDVKAMVEKAGYRSARGDRYFRGEQTKDRLFELDALNAPISLPLFMHQFPAPSY